MRRHFGAARRRRRGRWSTNARRRSSRRSSRSRGWSTSSRSSRGCRRRRPCPTDLNRCSTRRWRSTTGCSATIRIERRFDGDAAAGAHRRRADPAGRHQPRRQRRRGARRRRRRGAPGRRSRRPSSSRRSTIGRNGVVRIVVTDNGPGIPAADRDKLFMPYYSTKRRGSGLGLAIVRRIIVEHGGSIEVADNEPTGTRFIVELPCEAARPHESLGSDRRRRSRRAQRAERRAARRGLSGRGRRERRGLPRTADASAVRRDRARHLAARAWTAWRRSSGCASGASTRRS